MADQSYLEAQYSTPANLDARIALHSVHRSNPTSLWNWAWEKYDFRPEDRVLEVGCGTGDFWKFNQARLPQPFSVTFTDASLGMLNQIREKLFAT